MRKKIVIVAVALLSAVLPVSVCQAISLGFVPSTQTRNLGDLLSVDVVVSGLRSGVGTAPQIVSAYDLDVTYDSAILGNASVDFSPLEGVLGTTVGDPFLDDYWTGANLSAGRIDFWALSFLFDAQLFSLQGNSVTLATLNFKAIGLGTSALTLDSQTYPGIDIKGLNATELALDVNNGSVTVIDGGTPAVPEPGTFLLLGGGLAGLAFWRRRIKR